VVDIPKKQSSLIAPKKQSLGKQMASESEPLKRESVSLQLTDARFFNEIPRTLM
jgi:hypothetical protein